MIETNKLIVRRLFDECFNQHNVDIYSQFHSEAFAYHAPSLGELGAEAHRQLLSSLPLSRMPDGRGKQQIRLLSG